MKYYLIAGEASGDLHASRLMHALKKEDLKADFRFWGGDLMAKEGGELVKHYRDLAYMGFVPVLLHLREILHNISFCKQDIKDYQPDVVIFVDYPGFNLRIAKYVHSVLKIPTNYYISPKIWAWKERRIKEIKQNVDALFSILPFEVDFYKKHNYQIEYVGNPTVDEILGQDIAIPTFDDFIRSHNLPNKKIVALLAGSRKQEIKANLRVMTEVITHYPDYQFVIAGAPGVEVSYYKKVLADVSCPILFNQTFVLLSHSTAALVTSGTATLETALFNVPQVVCYHLNIPKWLYKPLRPLFLKVPYISLVNLIADESVCPELVAYMLTSENLKRELDALLFNQNTRKNQLIGYSKIRRILGKPGGPERAARMIFQSLT